MFYLWQRFLSLCALAAALIIGLSAVFVSYDVIARNVGLPSLYWVVDLSEYALPLATLLVAPWLALRGGHIRIDFITLFLPQKAKNYLNQFIHLSCAVFSGVMVWYSTSVTLESFSTGAIIMKNAVFPEWYVYAPMPFCFVLISIEFLRQVFSPGEDSSIDETI